jgi:peptidoglycan/LPS O-acetylase OafA/YrhL
MNQLSLKQLNYINALRGIAVLCVIVVHVGLHSLSGKYQNIVGQGAKGVQLFYFISAFTLFLSSNKRLSLEKNAKINFFIRRFFRIAPLYYLAIIYYSFIIPFIQHQDVNYKGIALNFLFIHGFFPDIINSIVPGGWSIAIEMTFYLFLPFLTPKINSLAKAILFLFFSFFLKTLFYYVLKGNPFNFETNLWTNYLYWYLPNQLPVFALGIVFYFIALENNVKQALSENSKLILQTLIAILVLLLIDKMILKIKIFNLDFVFTIAFLIVATILKERPFKAIVNSFTELIGKLSFSMYLIHFAVIYWLSKAKIISIDKPSSLSNFIYSYSVVLVFTVLLSSISYRFIESKGQKIGKRVIDAL